MGIQTKVSITFTSVPAMSHLQAAFDLHLLVICRLFNKKMFDKNCLVEKLLNEWNKTVLIFGVY
jgi:hypothetical protein